MLNNSETELSLTKKPEIIHKIYKQKLSVEENLNKEEENTTNLQDSHNLSSNLLNQEQKLFPSNKKINEIVLDNSKNINFKINSNANNQLKKINKKVSFKEPFFSVIYLAPPLVISFSIVHPEVAVDSNGLANSAIYILVVLAKILSQKTASIAYVLN